jgi:hypothetical protein
LMNDCVHPLSGLLRQELCDREENSEKQSLARDNMAVAINLPLMILCLELSPCLVRLKSREKQPSYPIPEAHNINHITLGSHLESPLEFQILIRPNLNAVR